MQKIIKVPYSKIIEGYPENVSITLKLEPTCTVGGLPGNCGIGHISNVQCQYVLVDTADRALAEAQPPGFQMNQWGGISTKHTEKVKDYIRELNKVPYEDDPNMPWPEVLADITAQLRRAASKYGVYVLSDGINKHAECRSAGMGYSTSWGYRGTADFVRALLRNKVGYVVQSPVGLNPSHNTDKDFGFVQAWFWCPPGTTAFQPNKYLGRGTIARSAEEACDEYMKLERIPPTNKHAWLARFQSWEKPVTIKRALVKKPVKVVAKEDKV
jgi:hypothetical protein